MPHPARYFLTLAAALCIAAPGAAQDAGVSSGSPATASQASPVAPGPTLSGQTVGVRQVATASAEAPRVQQSSNSRNVTWMIVGGAALVVGSVVGGDAGTIIMVTGAVIGLVGLFRYLQ